MARNIKQLMEILAILYCISAVYGQKMKFGIHAVILIIAELFLMTGINEYGFPTYLLSLSYLGFFVYCLLCYQENVKKTLIKLLLALAVTSVLQLIIYLPVFQIFIIKNGPQEPYEIAINFGCLILVVLLTPRLRLKELSEFLIKNNIVLVIITGCILGYLGMRIYQIKITQLISGDEYIEVVCFVLLLFFAISEWQKTKMDAEKKNAQLRMNNLYYNAYDDLLALVRDRQHDMKNHITAILGMIYTSTNYEELASKQREYCNYVLEQSESAKLVLSVENPLIAGFLYSKIKEAEAAGIAVEHKISICEKDLPFPEYEIVEMAGILLDNAIEALSNCTETLKKIIVNIIYEDILKIEISNVANYFNDSMIEQFFERNYSSKGNGRGIGLDKLKRMVKEKNGEIIIRNETIEEINYLKFTIVLPIEKEKDRNS